MLAGNAAQIPRFSWRSAATWESPWLASTAETRTSSPMPLGARRYLSVAASCFWEHLRQSTWPWTPSFRQAFAIVQETHCVVCSQITLTSSAY
eukprot:7484561-Pyramimonas_sp.AAC.4